MAKRVSLALVLATVAAITATLLAAPQATLILRSGDRVKGELVDMGGSGFTVRVRGAEQNIPTGDVAVIDFSGAAIPAAEAARIQDGRALVVLHNGDTFYGRLFDIGGNNPLRITFRTQDGDRDVNSDQVARIYLSRWEGMPPPAPPTPSVPNQPDLDPGGAGITIPANPCWTNTRMSVRQNQRATFNGSGEIQLSADAQDIAGVAGSRRGRYAPNAPIRGALAGALIGRVGNGQPFEIGDRKAALPMPASGQLFLGINDDNCGDNRGQFKVSISMLR
jgi:hypothetical protein